MNPMIKKSIAVAGSIALLGIAYYGSFLPLRKGMLFIETMQASAQVKTIDDFEKGFSEPLDFPSPIGQEELVRSMANTVLSSMQRVPDPRGVEEMIRYTEQEYAPIIARGKGMSYNQNLYLLGLINEYGFIKTGKQEYLDAATKYFEQSRELGPKRPQALYGLLDAYRLAGNLSSAKAVAQQILSQWPDDTKTQDTLNQIIASSTAPGAKLH
jgi:tetratricopeptide (TPR) repeat protein